MEPHCAAVMLCLLGLSLSVSAGNVAATSLYDKKDKITELDRDSFDPTVYGRDKAFFIEFYSSWCGGCIAYAPKFKQIARYMAPWAAVLEVGSVNCADEKNTDLCQAHGIEMFPTLKYFKYQSKSKDDGVKYEEERQNVEKLTSNIAFIAYNDWRNQEPVGWPDFLLLSNTQKLGELYEEKPWGHIAVVVDDSEIESPRVSGFAAKIILDWSSVAEVGVVMARSSHPAVGGQAKDSPGLLIFQKGDPDPVFVSRKAMVRDEMTARIGEYSDGQMVTDVRAMVGAGPRGGALPKVPATAPPAAKAPVHLRDVYSAINRYQVTMDDMVVGIHYMLYQEIPLKTVIKEEQFIALRHFLSLMAKYFPGLPPLRRLLFRLSNDLDEWKEPQMSATDWKAIVQKHQEELGRPLPWNATWVACQGSEAKWRGYPCSLWTIFHALTVAAYKAHGIQDPKFDAGSVLLGIREYVVNFFGCGECAAHFEEHAAQIGSKVKRPEDVVLWLWTVHNDANRRTKDTLSSDPAFPKEQFPSAALCPNCRSASGEWDNGMVLGFLMKYYGDDIVVGKEKLSNYKVVSFDKEGKKGGDSSQRGEWILEVAAKALDLNPKFRRLGEKVGEFEKREIMLQREREKFEAGDEVRQAKLGNPRSYAGWSMTEGLNGMDLSLCLLLWAGSVVLVGGLCFFFKFRKLKHRYWKTNEHRV